jgi:hypothetical protein
MRSLVYFCLVSALLGAFQSEAQQFGAITCNADSELNATTYGQDIADACTALQRVQAQAALLTTQLQQQSQVYNQAVKQCYADFESLDGKKGEALTKLGTFVSKLKGTNRKVFLDRRYGLQKAFATAEESGDISGLLRAIPPLVSDLAKVKGKKR